MNEVVQDVSDVTRTPRSAPLGYKWLASTEVLSFRTKLRRCTSVICCADHQDDPSPIMAEHDRVPLIIMGTGRCPWSASLEPWAER